MKVFKFFLFLVPFLVFYALACSGGGAGDDIQKPDVQEEDVPAGEEVTGEVCTPHCTDKECGDDGCGGVCGSCTGGKECVNDKCLCVDQKYKGCYGDAVYWFDSCGKATIKVTDCQYWCSDAQCKACPTDCAGKECGDDGCGGSCGQCTGGGQVCVNGKCVSDSYYNVSSKLPDTGQEECYDDDYEIPCPAPGADFFGQDAQYATNKMSFKNNGDGTVTDNVTGLIWMKCSAGLSGSNCSSGSAQKKTWQEAIDYCKNNTMGLSGSGWRLPSTWELLTIVDYGKWYPAIDTTYFPNTEKSLYWISSSNASNGYDAWGVNFHYGFLDHIKDNSIYVRCVRSGQLDIGLFKDNGNGTVTDAGAGLMWQKATAPGTYTWKDALKYCEDLTLAGYPDWRLPDIKELSSIVDDSKYWPAIDTTYFPDAQNDPYWSSSSFAVNVYYAWLVLFGGGYVYYSFKYDGFYVRCVRSGQ